MENKDIQIRILDVQGIGYLRAGKYDLAEEDFRKQLSLLRELQQEKRTRIHKGGAFHNLGISLMFQGKSDEALKSLTFAYVEDLISSKNPVETDLAPASSVLRGLCGCAWSDLEPIEHEVCTTKEQLTIFDPEQIINIEPEIELIQSNYKKYLRYTWQFEINGQKGLEKKDYELVKRSYGEWLETLISYQGERKTRVHKGHPLFNLAIPYLEENHIDEGLNNALQACIEDILSCRDSAYFRRQPAFNLLLKLGIGLDFLDKLASWILSKKASGKVDNPKELLAEFSTKEEQKVPKIAEMKKEERRAIIENTTSPKITIDKFPGKYAKRVFIGGSYGGDYLGKLKEISEYVRSLGFYPVLMIDYDPPRREDGSALLNIHDLAVLLIHNCHYAIFELSEAAGQYNEIEWSIRFLRKPTFGLCQANQENQVSSMIKDLFSEANETIFCYSTVPSMKDYIKSKLVE